MSLALIDVTADPPRERQTTIQLGHEGGTCVRDADFRRGLVLRSGNRPGGMVKPSRKGGRGQSLNGDGGIGRPQ